MELSGMNSAAKTVAAIGFGSGVLAGITIGAGAARASGRSTPVSIGLATGGSGLAIGASLMLRHASYDSHAAIGVLPLLAGVGIGAAISGAIASVSSIG